MIIQEKQPGNCKKSNQVHKFQQSGFLQVQLIVGEQHASYLAKNSIDQSGISAMEMMYFFIPLTSNQKVNRYIKSAY
jgi:hypothetical protein